MSLPTGPDPQFIRGNERQKCLCLPVTEGLSGKRKQVTIWPLNPNYSTLALRVVHNFSSSWQKFLSSRIVIIERRRRSLLGGCGGMPPGNFYILSPQKQNFLDSAHKFPVMSVPKVIITFQFCLCKLMPLVVFM